MKSRRKRAQLPFRVNILFFFVFFMFSILIIQLGIVQILDGKEAQEEIDRTIQDTTKVPVPRGKILDRNYNVIVDNEARYAITYTPAKGTQAEERLEVAENLAKYISMDDKETLKGITDRDKREYWYLKNEEEVISRLSDEEIDELDDTEQYDLMLKRISEEEIAEFDNDTLEVIAIKKELDKAYSLTPQIIKNEDITVEEYAQVAEHLDKLPGVNATTDWERKFPYKDTFKSFIGSITSQDEGILADKEQYYLSRGYNRNDRVGKSGLEEQYEDLLRGRKEEIEYTTTKTGKVIDSKVVVEGERGKDLVLTIDMEFQEKLDEIVLNELKKTKQKHPHANRFLKDAMAVAINPKTGELLAVSGQHFDKKDAKYEKAGYRALYDAHRPGSSIKGATVLAGFESGAITPGKTFYDRPIRLAGSNPMSSYGGGSLGPVNDITALERSSNVYMYYIALRMGGEYRYPFPDNASPTFNVEAFQEMRNYYSQLGLGVATGVDYPYESTGYEGPTKDVVGIAGLFPQFAIGQYDTYTTLQLAQYVSTIANDGYRVRPHFLKDVHEPIPEDSIGALYESYHTDVLNKIEMDQSEIDRVQEGFRRVFQGSKGTGYSYWSGKSYNPAGKTGTAQNDLFIDGVKYETENLTLVGYAPYDDPEIAFAVIVPNLGSRSGDGINHRIGTGLMDAYFDLKKDRGAKEEE